MDGQNNVESSKADFCNLSDLGIRKMLMVILQKMVTLSAYFLGPEGAMALFLPFPRFATDTSQRIILIQ